MNETLVTLVGNAATGVEYRETVGGGMARFRFAVTPRRWDRGKQLWTDGHTSFYTVWAWRALAANLCGSVSVGEPLVVHGRLRVREDEREDRHRTSVDVEAVAVGHDLSRGTAAFRRVMRAGPGPDARPAGAAPDGTGDSGTASARPDGPDWSGGAPGWGAGPGAAAEPGAAGVQGAGGVPGVPGVPRATEAAGPPGAAKAQGREGRAKGAARGGRGDGAERVEGGKQIELTELAEVAEAPAGATGAVKAVEMAEPI